MNFLLTSRSGLLDSLEARNKPETRIKQTWLIWLLMSSNERYITGQSLETTYKISVTKI